jgi:hypothetical protein
MAAVDFQAGVETTAVIETVHEFVKGARLLIREGEGNHA